MMLLPNHQLRLLGKKSSIYQNIIINKISNTNRIYLCLAHMSEAGMEQKFIKEAFDTNWVVPLGPNVNGFEADLEAFCGQGKRVHYHLVQQQCTLRC